MGRANAPHYVVVDNEEVVVVAPNPSSALGPFPDFEVNYGVGLVTQCAIGGGAYVPFAPSRDAVTLSLANCSPGGDDCSLADDADPRWSPW